MCSSATSNVMPDGRITVTSAIAIASGGTNSVLYVRTFDGGVVPTTFRRKQQTVAALHLRTARWQSTNTGSVATSADGTNTRENTNGVPAQ